MGVVIVTKVRVPARQQAIICTVRRNNIDTIEYNRFIYQSDTKASSLYLYEQCSTPTDNYITRAVSALLFEEI